MGWFDRLFNKKVSFANKSDADIINIFSDLSASQRQEVFNNVCKKVAIAETVAQVKGIQLNRFSYTQTDKYYNEEEYYGLTTYLQMKHVYDLINKR